MVRARVKTYKPTFKAFTFIRNHPEVQHIANLMRGRVASGEWADGVCQVNIDSPAMPSTVVATLNSVVSTHVGVKSLEEWRTNDFERLQNVGEF